MTNRSRTVHGPRRVGWVLRALIACTALIGIVAMHGLTMNHNTTMATMTADMGTAHNPNHSMALPSSATTAKGVSMAPALDSIEQLASATSHLVAPHPMGEMATACVAYLTGLLLVAAGATLNRTIRVSDAPHRVVALRWLPAAVERLRPDLAQLSVLRT